MELVYLENISFGKVFYYNPRTRKGIAIEEDGNPFVKLMPSNYNPFVEEPGAIVLGLTKKVFNEFFNAGRNGDRKCVEEIIEKNFPKEWSPEGYLVGCW